MAADLSGGRTFNREENCLSYRRGGVAVTHICPTRGSAEGAPALNPLQEGNAESYHSSRHTVRWRQGMSIVMLSPVGFRGRFQPVAFVRCFQQSNQCGFLIKAGGRGKESRLYMTGSFLFNTEISLASAIPSTFPPSTQRSQKCLVPFAFPVTPKKGFFV